MSRAIRTGLACALFATTLVVVAAAWAARPPNPTPDKALSAGQPPSVCGTNDLNVSLQGATYGSYYSAAANAWVSAPYCFARWGNLEASAPQIVRKGKSVTVVATPTDGSNSGTYAPQTNSITWTYPGKRVSGCGAADLTCTSVPTTTGSDEWQWFEYHVSMPRTFFIDSQGSNCAGQHLCAGFATNAWSYAGVSPSTARIVATVRDSKGKGVPAVKIVAKGPARYTGTTSTSGKVTLEAKRAGTYHVTASGQKLHFKPATKSVVVRAGKTSTVAFAKTSPCVRSSSSHTSTARPMRGLFSTQAHSATGREYTYEGRDPNRGTIWANVNPCAQQISVSWYTGMTCDGYQSPTSSLIVSARNAAGFRATNHKLPVEVTSVSEPGAQGFDRGNLPIVYTVTATGVHVTSKSSLTIDQIKASSTYVNLYLPNNSARRTHVTCHSPTFSNVTLFGT